MRRRSELYKKFKNHGPFLKWAREFRDAEIEFEMKAADCQRVVFTLNGDGHIFRITLADETEQSKLGPSKVPTGMPDVPTINGKWVKVKLSVQGDHADLVIGDFKTSIQHASLVRDKNMVMLTFAHGELAVRGFRMTY